MFRLIELGRAPKTQKEITMSQSPATIIGNVTDDPKLTFTADGKPRLAFSVAVNHYWTDASGDKQEKVSYINVIAWRYLADDSANVLEKGVGIIVTGRLEQRSWEDKETGAKRSIVELVADAIGVQTRSIDSFERKRRSSPDGQQTKKASAPRQAARQVIEEDSEPF